MPLYDRVGSILVGPQGGTGRLLEGIDFSFEVEKFAEGQPSVGRADVYGLSETTRGAIKAGRDVMTISAGYRDSPDGARQCCVLDVIDVRVEYKPPEIVTVISGSDGAHMTRARTLAVSYKKKSVKEIIRDVARQLGASLKDFVLGDIDDATFQNGFSEAGTVTDILDKVCGRVNATWSFQDGQLQVAPADAPVTGEIVMLNADTGLIGRPEPRHRVESVYVPVIRPGWIVTSLMNPRIVPNGRVHLSSELLNVSAVYRVLSVKHSGDTRGKQWYTTADLSEW